MRIHLRYLQCDLVSCNNLNNTVFPIFDRSRKAKMELSIWSNLFAEWKERERLSINCTLSKAKMDIGGRNSFTSLGRVRATTFLKWCREVWHRLTSFAISLAKFTIFALIARINLWWNSFSIQHSTSIRCKYKIIPKTCHFRWS